MARKKKIDKVSLEETKKKFANVADTIIETSISNFLKENFLPYAWSYNLDRALVDTTGLKPVHKRILYTMYINKLHPNANRSKVATLAGKTMEFHPHGNMAIEEALKNLALDYMFRVPMINGKGDFGSPGEPGAAGRYIEARLSKAGWINLEEIAENAVPMIPNYDDSTVEPSRLPVKWPVGVINGTSGIAIGYASKIPSHNPREVMEACKLLIKNPDATVDDILEVIKGPDFWMGGKITSIDGVKEYLETGSGTFYIRGQYEITPLPRGIYQIDFDEVPTETNPKKIIKDIQKAIVDKGRLKDIAEYKDLSDLKHPVRVRIITKAGVNYRKVLEELFKETSLESSFSANITTIVNGKPLQTGIIPLLKDFINHRKSCVFNKTEYKHSQIESKLHLLNGLILILADIDKAISIIRNANDASDANKKLCKQFKIDEVQADYILSVPLRRLTKFDTLDINKTQEEYIKTLKEYEKLMTDNETMNSYLLKEFDETLEVIDVERTTDISNKTEEEIQDEMKRLREEKKLSNKKVDCYVTTFTDNVIMKTLEPFHYADVKYAKYGLIKESIKTSTNGNLLFVYEDGKAQRIMVSNIPMDEPKEIELVSGSKVPLVGISQDSLIDKTDIGTLILTKKGKVRILKTDHPKDDIFDIVSLEKGDKLISSQWITQEMYEKLFIYSISNQNKILKYKLDGVSPSGIGSQPIASHNINKADEILYAKADIENAFISFITKDELKVIMGEEINPKGRNSQGMMIGAKDVIPVNIFISRVQAFGVRTARNLIIELPESSGRTTKGTPSKETDILLGLL